MIEEKKLLRKKRNLVEKEKKIFGEGDYMRWGRKRNLMDAGEGIDRGDRERNCARRKNQYRLKVIQEVHKT